MVSVGPSKPRPPLHDFPLPDWNWSKNRPVIGNPLRRGSWKSASASTSKSPESPPLSAKLAPTSSLCDGDSDNGLVADERWERRRSPGNQGFRSARAAIAERPEPDARSKTLIRLCVKNRADAAAVEDGRVRDLQDSEANTKAALNLRPRKSGRSGSSPPATVAPIITSNPRRPESLKRLRNHAEAKVAVKEGKMTNKFEIPLSKKEIIEDIFVMTGMKPSRRPKKRSKTVQKQLDSVFPGLWLPYIDPDSYTVPEKPPKKV